MSQTDGQMDEQGHGWTYTHALDVAESPPLLQGKIALR